MNMYHEPALAGNAFGLPFAADFTLSNHHQPFAVADLTRGGRVIYERSRRTISPALSNALASAWGLGQELDNAR